MKAIQGPASRTMVDAWNSVFVSDRPGTGYPFTLAHRRAFTPAIQEFMFLFPVDGYYLTVPQFSALGAVLAMTGESEYYVSTYEDEDDFLRNGEVRGDPRHYVLDASDGYEAYCSAVPWPLEYAVYSSAGSWGLIVSHGMHAMLGGSEELLFEFKVNHVCWMQDLAALKHYWEDNPNRAWLDELLPLIEGGLTIAPAPHPDDE